MDVVLIAPNVSETMGGEAIKVYQYASYLIECGVRVSLIVHARSRGQLDALEPLVDVHYLEDDVWQRLAWKSIVGRPLLDILFFLRARRCAQQIHQERPGAVFHYMGPVSPVVPRFPLRGAQCILGPITGNIYYPPGMQSSQPFGLRWRQMVHHYSQKLLRAILPEKGLFSRILVSGGERTRHSLRLAGASDVQLLDVIDSGISDALCSGAVPRYAGTNPRFIAMGRLVPDKGIDLAIRAIAQTADPISLDVYGIGPELKRLKRLVAQLGVEDRVQFKGWLPNGELADRMREYRGLLFPSLAETNGIVIQEALAIGIPIVCVDWGGPAVLTTEQTAIRIEPKSEAYVVEQLALHMTRLAEDPDQAARLVDAGVASARESFRWPAVAQQWMTAYKN